MHDNRVLAGVGLCFFAFLGIVMGIWGVNDISNSLASFRTCASPVMVHTGFFWMIGCFSWVLFPFLLFSRNERYHKIITAIFASGFIALPIATMTIVHEAKDRHGYVPTAGSWSLFSVDDVRFETVACAPTL